MSVNFNHIVKTSLEYRDINRLKFEKKYKYIEPEIFFQNEHNVINKTGFDLDYIKNNQHLFFFWFDMELNKYVVSRYEIIFLATFHKDIDKTFINWSWSLPFINSNEINYSYKLFQYVINLDCENYYQIKKMFLNTNIKINYHLEVQIYMAIAIKLFKISHILHININQHTKIFTHDVYKKYFDFDNNLYTCYVICYDLEY